MPQAKIHDYSVKARKILRDLELLDDDDTDEAVELLHQLSDTYDNIKSYWGIL